MGAARPFEELWYVVTKFRKAVSLKTSKEDRKAGSVVADFKELKKVSKRREAKAFNSTLSKRILWVETTHT